MSEALKIGWQREKLRAMKVYPTLNASEKAIINKGKVSKTTTWKPTESDIAALTEMYSVTGYKGD